MKNTVCPNCSSCNKVSEYHVQQVVSCPQCNSPYMVTKDTTRAMTELEKKRFARAGAEVKVIACVIGGLIFIGIPTLLIGGYKYLDHHYSEVAKEKEEQSSSYSSGGADDVHGAWAYMQIAVQQRLKNPRSADFPFGGSRHVTPLGADRYRVSSYVDAKNSYGAEMRTNFNGVIKKVSGGWQVESLKIQQ